MRSRSESLEFALLGLLAENSLHGYELRKRLTSIFGPFRALSFSVLYPQLKRMLEAGLIAQAEVPKGGAALNWLNDYAPARMTGTGSSIFAGFSSRAAAEQVLADLPTELTGFIAKGINKSPVLQALGFD